MVTSGAATKLGPVPASVFFGGSAAVGKPAPRFGREGAAESAHAQRFLFTYLPVSFQSQTQDRQPGACCNI